MNGNIDKEYYNEGIYVGYRYFDSFDKEVEYPLDSAFPIHSSPFMGTKVELPENNDRQDVRVSAVVKNRGTVYFWKRSCPGLCNLSPDRNGKRV